MQAGENISAPPTCEAGELIAFRAVAECLPEPMVLVTSDLLILGVNRAAVELLSASCARDVEGTRFASGNAQRDEGARNFLRICATSGQFLFGSISHLTNQGTTLDLRAEGATFRRFGESAANLVVLRLKLRTRAAAPFLDLSRQIERLNREILVRTATEKSLRLSEARFRHLAESIPAIIWSVDEHGQVDFINEHYCQYTGHPNSLVGMAAWSEIVHPDDAAASRQTYRECIQRGVAWESELRLKRRDGQYRWHLSRCIPLPDPDLETTRWIASSFDIDDVKRAEQVLRSTNTELEQRVAERTHELESMNRELEGFTYSVSHDLRAPLRAIVATCRIIEEDYSERLPPDAIRLLQRQAAAANRLGNLIDDLLKISRLGRQQMAFATVNLSQLADEVSAELAPANAFVEIQPNLVGECDASVMRLVLENLIGNAVKFCRAGEAPRVSFGRLPSGTFYVMDQGIGFDPKYARKVFLPFERLHTEEQFAGTGIGLASVKLAIERHGGQVWVKTRPNEGATFFFTLQETGRTANLNLDPESAPEAPTRLRP